ncbi:MAG: hypothetical protein U9N56_10155 [Actinomycetota bacterium]|nr:hypothetical protein [Actinomycetota bacterium]
MIRVMAGRHIKSRDSAFLWETEALRSAAPRSAPPIPVPPQVDRSSGDWLTLRKASEATGIPVPTLRKWARRESVPSYLEETPTGQLRMVSLTGVLDRARKLGREIEVNVPVEEKPEAIPEPKAEPAAVPEFREEQPAVPAPPAVSDEPAVPPGTMLVPIDAWDKMLLQLGNLHQAGQQLAEARERAGKAETEAKFLKERLTEMRAELAEQKSQPHTPPPEPAAPVEPISHIPIESPDDDIEPPDDDLDIPVRDLGKVEPTVPDRPSDSRLDEQDDSMTLTGYSIEMMKHVYSTWRGRPRR